MNIITSQKPGNSSKLFLPILFILLWSAGYPIGKIALSYTGPYTLLLLRFASAALIMLFVSLFTKATWPQGWQQWLHLIVVGLLTQGIDFACLYTGMNLGVSAGVTALIVGTMPILIALVASRLFNEVVNLRQWGGAFLGLFGVGLVVMQENSLAQASWLGYFFVVLALFALTAGTLYQKRFCAGFDLRTANCIQLTTASLFVIPLAWHFEEFKMHWGFPLLATSAWLSLANSIGGFTIWFVLMKRGEASKVSSLFHLIPGVTAIMGYFILGEILSPLVLLGFVITGLAVYLSH
jgi:drug/metabolite transporter (DMT)-like permease